MVASLIVSSMKLSYRPYYTRLCRPPYGPMHHRAFQSLVNTAADL
jgi:hypothetical protein